MDRGEAVGRIGTLSDRELEVLQELVDGHGPVQFSERLYISRNTARTHVKNVLVKLGAHSCLEAVSIAVCEGMRPRALVATTDPVEYDEVQSAVARNRSYLIG